MLHHGAIAQLGERLICIQEVRGSIPRSSTILFSNEVRHEILRERGLVPGLYDRLFFNKVD